MIYFNLINSFLTYIFLFNFITILLVKLIFLYQMNNSGTLIIIILISIILTFFLILSLTIINLIASYNLNIILCFLIII